MRSSLVTALLLLSGCAATGSSSSVVVSPKEHGKPAPWTEPEQRAAYAERALRRTPEASFHLLRIGAEFPGRQHANSDLVLVVVSGRIDLTLADHTLALKPGAVVEVPRGSSYAARNRAPEASTVYIVHTPAHDPGDVIVAGKAPAETAWKWNLWQQ